MFLLINCSVWLYGIQHFMQWCWEYCLFTFAHASIIFNYIENHNGNTLLALLCLFILKFLKIVWKELEKREKMLLVSITFTSFNNCHLPLILVEVMGKSYNCTVI